MAGNDEYRLYAVLTIMDSSSDKGLEYIGSTDYKKLSGKIRNLHDVAFDLTAKVLASRKLRYTEIDIDIERKAGRIAPDEIYVPLHIIDTNIRREQSSYVQYITQSPRAVILKDQQDQSIDLSLLEVDLTEKLRFSGWQLAAYANIDGFQANGYGVMETTQDLNNPGEIGREYVQYGDFAFIADTRDLNKCEMVARAYYFTKTKLVGLTKSGGEEDKWSDEQVEKLVKGEPNDEQSQVYSGTTTINRSLYKVYKIMFKVKGVVQVAWAAPLQCDGWLRNPRPLFIGRRKLNDIVNTQWQAIAQQIQQNPVLRDKILAYAKTKPEFEKYWDKLTQGIPASDPSYETDYPYFLYPYLISENDTIANLKGRIFLDQDTQNAASSLMSNTLTQARRASQLVFSKDTTDPNDDFLIQKNVLWKQGAIINGKIKEFKLEAPDPQMFTAINLLISANQQETSQVNFAESNRQQDSRKTATAIKAATQQQQQLSGTQVTLYSMATKKQYTYECDIIKSRVLAGLIEVSDTIRQLYSRTWSVKPSGDTDVIEKQQMIATMQQTWPVVQNTPCADIFLNDLLEKMFPDSAAKYIQAINAAKQQQQSQQAQQMQQAVGIAKQLGMEIQDLDNHPEYFSETGRVHAYPKIQMAAQQVGQIQKHVSGK